MGDPRCMRCQSTMEVGYVVDQGYSRARSVATWEAGVPEKSFWLGLSTKGKTPHPITTWRCTRCGMLEHYAVAGEA